MTSRLFQAVVGAGIALGVADAGCLADAHDSAGGPAIEGTGPTVQAFCDAPWPTTKGAATTPPSCADPVHKCAGLTYSGAACVAPSMSATWACPYSSIFPACVGGRWECPTSAWTCSVGEMHPPGDGAADGGAE
jgi:hypothetical protein